MEFKYLNSIYKHLKNFPIGIGRNFFLIILYIILANFFVKSDGGFKFQILYILPIFFLVSIKFLGGFEEKINWALILFLIGIIDDVIFQRFIGISSLFYLCFFYALILILRKFKNNIFVFNVISISIFAIYSFYSILVRKFFSKLEFFSINFENRELNLKEIVFLELNSLLISLIVFFIFSFFYRKKTQHIIIK
jgi:hypothetical protein